MKVTRKYIAIDLMDRLIQIVHNRPEERGTKELTRLKLTTGMHVYHNKTGTI